MKNKAAVPLLAVALAAAAAMPARAELLKLDLLRGTAARFTMKLDIFRGGDDPGADAMPSGATAATQAQAEIMQRTIAEEIAQSVSFEGFIQKKARPLALLNVSGDFFTVGEGESILDKIRVLKITREMVTIEYEGQAYEIRIKGDQNG